MRLDASLGSVLCRWENIVTFGSCLLVELSEVHNVDVRGYVRILCAGQTHKLLSCAFRQMCYFWVKLV